MKEQQNIKVYVNVRVDFNSDGRMMPRRITWENGEKYTVDRVVDIKPAPALRSGGQGDRYTIIVNGIQSYIWFERSADITGANLGKWFVERRTA